LNVEVNKVPIVIAFHSFPDGSWSSGKGWLYPWNTAGDSRIVFGGHSLPMQLMLRRGTGYAERAVDLSSYPNARLSFWARIRSFEAGDEAYVKVSPDHANWTTLKTFTFNDSDNVYRYYEFDLSSFALSSEFWIAFEAGMSGRRDYFYVDDVNVFQI
jgi:hypothetical protein